MAEPCIEVTLADGTALIWHPGQETPYAVTVLEDFLGPADQVIAP